MAAFRPAPIPVATVISAAWKRADEILKSRDGAGFIFRVHTAAGVFEGPPPSEQTGPTDDGLLELEDEGGVFIRQGDITAITVIEC